MCFHPLYIANGLLAECYKHVSVSRLHSSLSALIENDVGIKRADLERSFAWLTFEMVSLFLTQGHGVNRWCVT